MEKLHTTCVGTHLCYSNAHHHINNGADVKKIASPYGNANLILGRHSAMLYAPFFIL